jgi:regulator of sirC expression with transglutaminase-like and TPR domain
MHAPVNDTELIALIRLLEDPDEAVYEPVSKRILEYGTQAIPHLEHAWETTEETEQQLRVEFIIRRIHFLEIAERLHQWRTQERPDLWEGMLILDRLHHREDRSDTLRSSLEILRRNAWLELNQYLTPLEQINVLSRVLFEHERFKGVDAARDRLEHLFPGDILLSRTGNQLGIGLLIQVLAEKLDLPLYAFSVPGIFVLGSPNIIRSREKKGIDSIDFYLDPQTGELFGRAEIEHYLRRIHKPLEESYFRPLTPAQLIDAWLTRLRDKCIEAEENQLAAFVSELLAK